MRVSVTVHGMGDLIDQLLDDEAKKAGLDLYTDLVMNTPVDTGHLRNSYHLDDTGNQIIVTNDVPYAMKVMNDGHSKQAPAGTLDTIIQRHTD